MALLRLMTSNDSTYLVGPSPTIPNHVRVARLGRESVRGTLGPAAFATDTPAAQLVAGGGELRLQWTDEDGATICTSPIQDVAAWSVDDTTSTPA